MSQSSKVHKSFGTLVSGDSATVTANQVISTTGATTFDSSAGAITGCTLPVPREAGIVKVLLQVGSGTNNVVVNSLFRTGGSTDTTAATFNAADESLILVSTGTRWQVLLNTGTVGLA